MSLTSVAPHFLSFSRAATAAKELFRLVDRSSQIDPLDQQGDTPERVIGDVELSNVNFEYPSRPGTRVLENFSLRIPSGKVTALVVRSVIQIHASED